MFGKFKLVFIFLLLLNFSAFAQDLETLSIIVTDQNGDLITAGFVSLTDAEGKKAVEIEIGKTKTNKSNLVSGNYNLEIQSPGFKTYRNAIEIKKGQNNFEIQLELEDVKVAVEIERSEREKRIDEVMGGYLSQKEIDALPESGEDIKEELQRRYGDDILIRIDGDFEGSQVPSRAEISSIKVISNTFDAEFHEVGRTIIDIRTNTIADGFHGLGFFNFNNSILNARNSFDSKRLPEQRRNLTLFLSGPIIKKKTSFSFSTFGISSFDTRNFLGTISDANEIGNRKTTNRIRFSTFGIKHILSKDHLLNFKYQNTNFSLYGLGSFDLPERASTFSNPRHIFSLTESGTFKGKYINDIRVEFGKEFRKIEPENEDTTIIVLEAFNRGSSGLNLRDEATKFRLVDDLAFDAGNHSLKLGTEIEYVNFRSVSENNTNGKFIFSSLANFANQTPSQYSQTIGATNVKFSQTRAAFYFQDYLKISKALQLGLGLRYEWQNNLNDGNNFSPRIGYAWSPEKNGKFIVRGGVGVFYDWLDTNTLSSILSNNGRQGRNLIIINPGFPNPFAGGTVSQPLPPSVSKLADDLTNPYIFVAQNAFNYKLNKLVTFEGIYTFKRGLHHFRSQDINAPVNNVRPNPDFGRIQLLESSGVTHENSFELRINAYYKGVNIYGNYQLAKQTSDFFDALSLPTDSYNLQLDQGLSNLDQRHKLNLSFNFDVWKIKVSPAFKLESGFPYTITTGRDDNGDTVFNDRPFGIGRNTERGEWLKQIDVRLQRKLPMRYLGIGENKKRSINLNINIRNLFNTANLINYVGVQTSPFFGRATLASPARSIDLGLSFIF